MLSDRYLSVLSVTLVCCGQTVGWTKLKLGMAVGLGPGHNVLDGDPGHLQRGTSPILAHVCCGQTARWIKMPLGMEVELGVPHCVRRGSPSCETGTEAFLFGRCLFVAKRSPISATAEHLLGITSPLHKSHIFSRSHSHLFSKHIISAASEQSAKIKNYDTHATIFMNTYTQITRLCKPPNQVASTNNANTTI